MVLQKPRKEVAGQLIEAEAGTALTCEKQAAKTGAGRLTADPRGDSKPLLLLFSSRKPTADADSG